MTNTLILGGTRNLGHVAALSLLEAGHHVAVLNRGHTPDELPPEVERLRADRQDETSMRAALGGRSFDLVLDNTTYTDSEASQAVALFKERIARYVFISSGQVYLVRENLPRPFRECDYDGGLMPAPVRDSADYASWLYGIDKRRAERVFSDAMESRDFPVTTLRLPMVASERDHYGRIQAYVARLMDGGPILVPDEAGLPLRHVYVSDVARLVTQLAGADDSPRGAFNVSSGESLTLDEFLRLLSEIIGSSSTIVRAPRGILEREGLLPDCSPFSGKWMSELDNSLGVSRLGATYTAPEDYLSSIVQDYRERWTTKRLVPESYRQRPREIAFAQA